MKNETRKFSHESLQDADTIQDLLAALKKGIRKGEISLEDDNGGITLKPSGLLKLKISASQNDGLNVLDIHVSWHSRESGKLRKQLRISAG